MNYKKLLIFTLLLFHIIPTFLKAQYNCLSGCNDNVYINSSNPNTIEYDNMVSTFHSSIVKETDGVVKIWGQGTGYNGNDIAPPQIINSTNYPGLTGTILKFTGGSSKLDQQFAILTTNGLFVWGKPGTLLSSSIKNDTTFSSVSIGTSSVSGTNSKGLPAGVEPTNVKMLFGSYRTLVIVTCNGDVWVLSQINNKNGDGTSDDSTNGRVWHRVKKSSASNDYLTNVVAVRGTSKALIALTTEGKVYTWGSNTFLGNNTAASSNIYATEMTIPTGITPKMIGMTISESKSLTYYLLGTNGNLYALGSNSEKQIGDFTTTSRNNWTQVKKSSASSDYLTNVAWISPQEHDTEYGSINILTTDGKLYGWGENDSEMLGGINSPMDPTYMPGSISSTSPYNKTKLNYTDILIAVETGGHTTLTVKQCSNKFGYVGHKINGSMANNTTDKGFEKEYNFGDTVNLNICGAPTVPNVPTEIKICPYTTYSLENAHQGSVPSNYSLVWYTTSTKDAGTQVTTPIGAGTYYAFYIPASGPCTNPPYAQVVVSYYSTTEASDNNCYCTKPGSTIIGGLPTKLGITNQTKLAAWPGSIPNGHIALESKIDGFVITRVLNSSSITEPKKGMLIYDISAACVKLYNGTAWKCIARSCNE